MLSETQSAGLSPAPSPAPGKLHVAITAFCVSCESLTKMLNRIQPGQVLPCICQFRRARSLPCPLIECH